MAQERPETSEDSVGVEGFGQGEGQVDEMGEGAVGGLHFRGEGGGVHCISTVYGLNHLGIDTGEYGGM